MIETLVIRTELPRPAYGDLLHYAQAYYPNTRWIRGQMGRAVAAAGIPGGDLHFDYVGVGGAKGRGDVVAKLNLPALLYGREAKNLTLRPESVPAACEAAVRAVRYVLGAETPGLAYWRTSVVHANGTLEAHDGEAERWLEAAAVQLKALGKGSRKRAPWAQPGPLSWRINTRADEQVAIYSKTGEAGLRGPRGGVLVRVEDRIDGRRARNEYGDGLLELLEAGGAVSQGRVARWLERVGRQELASGADFVVERLLARGMPATDAYRLATPFLRMSAHGIQALIDDGVPVTTAYRWARELEAVVRDPASFLESAGVQLSMDDVVYADDHYERQQVAQ